MTVTLALELGYRIEAREVAPGRKAWGLVTPEAGWLRCPSFAVAWRTLVRHARLRLA